MLAFGPAIRVLQNSDPRNPLWSPRGDSNPLTYRLQIGCAAIAPLGPENAAPECRAAPVGWLVHVPNKRTPRLWRVVWTV